MLLLTGATGFIGSHLLPRLCSSHRVRCVVRPGGAAKIPAHPNVEILEGNLLDPAFVRKSMTGIESVIHLAALLRTKSAAEIERVNVGVTRLLVEAARESGAAHFLFTSSENARRKDLIDPYAETKRRAEAVVRGFPRTLILSPCFVYGTGDHHGLGRLIDAAEKYPFVPLFGGLKSRIQPIFIDDMVECLVRGIERRLEGDFMIAGIDVVNLNDFIKKACATRRIRKPFLTLPYPLLRLAAVCGDRLGPSVGWGTAQLKNIYDSRTYSIDQTVKAFGFAPRPLDEGLAQWLGGETS